MKPTEPKMNDLKTMWRTFAAAIYNDNRFFDRCCQFRAPDAGFRFRLIDNISQMILLEERLNQGQKRYRYMFDASIRAYRNLWDFCAMKFNGNEFSDEWCDLIRRLYQSRSYFAVSSDMEIVHVGQFIENEYLSLGL